MRSRAPLALMEQMVMIVVFALAAALCLQAFVSSDQMSRRDEARDRAVVLCQSVAETVRVSDGDMASAVERAAGAEPEETADGWTLDYDAEWTPVSADGVYRLTVALEEETQPGLGGALIQVIELDGSETVLFQLEVAWQEVTGLG